MPGMWHRPASCILTVEMLEGRCLLHGSVLPWSLPTATLTPPAIPWNSGAEIDLFSAPNGANLEHSNGTVEFGSARVGVGSEGIEVETEVAPPSVASNPPSVTVDPPSV